MDRLFAYGTLLAPELRRAIIGRPVFGVTACLRGYVRRRVRRAPYPAITAQSSAVTSGELYRGISGSEWGYLDDFESRLYRRELVAVDVGKSAPVCAYTYVIEPELLERLSDEPWDYEEFRRKRLQRYLARL